MVAEAAGVNAENSIVVGTCGATIMASWPAPETFSARDTRRVGGFGELSGESGVHGYGRSAANLR